MKRPSPDTFISIFLAAARRVEDTLARWTTDDEPYGMPGYRERVERDRVVYLAAAISWASR